MHIKQEIVVQKYGGTSVGDISNIKKVAQKIVQYKHEHPGVRLVVVVSAMAGETDRLEQLGTVFGTVPAKREQDLLLATGEQISIALLSLALKNQGIPAIAYLGTQLPIRTDHNHKSAIICSVELGKILTAFLREQVVIVAGFQGLSPTDEITTLGRGGSDTTAVAVGCALRADVCQIYTDVAGIYTADPRMVPNAKPLNKINYLEMLELASLGAKVLHLRSVVLAASKKLPLEVRSTFTDGGTIISYEEATTMQMEDFKIDAPLESVLITGISHKNDQVLVQVMLEKSVDHPIAVDPQINNKILLFLSTQQISWDMLQCNSTEICFVVNKNNSEKVGIYLTELQQQGKIDGFKQHQKLAQVSLVGLGLRAYPQALSGVLEVLAKHQIATYLISTGEIKVSLIIDESNLQRTLQILHVECRLEHRYATEIALE